MPEITGAAFTGSWAPCSWCGEPTDSLADTPGRPDLGRIPMHIICAAAVIVAYRRGRVGGPEGARFREVLARLEAGRPLELRSGEA